MGHLNVMLNVKSEHTNLLQMSITCWHVTDGKTETRGLRFKRLTFSFHHLYIKENVPLTKYFNRHRVTVLMRKSAKSILKKFPLTWERNETEFYTKRSLHGMNCIWKVMYRVMWKQ